MYTVHVFPCSNSPSMALTCLSSSRFRIPLPSTRPSSHACSPTKLSPLSWPSKRPSMLACDSPSPPQGIMAEMSSADAKADGWGEVFEWAIKGAAEEEVWAVTGNFVGVQKWVPNLLKSSERVAGEPQKPGCMRKCVLHPEPYTDLYEKLLAMDERLHHYKYTIVQDSTTAPGFSLMQDYVATFKLSPQQNGQGTLLQWGYTCHPVSTMSEDDAHSIVFSLFQAAVEALQERLSLPDDSITLISSPGSSF